MAPETEELPLVWRGRRVGRVVELWADMFWWHARWVPLGTAETEAFLAQVAEGEDPEVLVGGASPLRLTVTAATREELELKSAG